MNLDDTRVDKTRLYETRPGTWIAGAVAGILMSIGLVMAGDHYVQVAKGTANDATTVAKRAQPARVASTLDSSGVGRGCDLGSALCNPRCVAC